MPAISLGNASFVNCLGLGFGEGLDVLSFHLGSRFLVHCGQQSANTCSIHSCSTSGGSTGQESAPSTLESSDSMTAVRAVA